GGYRPRGGYDGEGSGGMRGGYGGAGGGMPYRGGNSGEYGMQAYTPPKHKLIRFTDTTVELGRKYRYRVRVRLNDPNHPRGDLLPPSLASLDEKVRTRIKEIDAADATKPKDANGIPYRTYWIDSPWSE